MRSTDGLCSSLLEAGSSWWVEPAIATLAFAVWMNIFRASERPLRSFTARIRSWPPNPLTLGIFSSLVFYWLGIIAWVLVVLPPPGIEMGCPTDLWSLGRLIAETCAGVVAYDFLFYWVHLAMHLWPDVGRLAGHWRHHHHDGHADASPDLETAMRTLNQSFLDGLVQVLVSICVQRHTPWGTVKVRLARWLHNIIVTGLLSESHSTGSLHIARRFYIFKGVRDHYLHHRHRGPPFQQFFSYLDDTVTKRLVPSVFVEDRKANQQTPQAIGGGLLAHILKRAYMCGCSDGLLYAALMPPAERRKGADSKCQFHFD